MNSPFTFVEANMYNGSFSPSTVHVKNTGLATFFKRYLLQEAASVFEITLPSHWSKNYFLYVLYCMGHIAVMQTDRYGVIPQHCTLGGYTVQYQPYYCMVTNPLFNKTYRLVIGRDCTIIKLEPDYCGIYDLVDYYGDLMALTAETLGGNILNSKLSYVFAAGNKAQAETLKKLYDNIASGEPAQFIDKNLQQEDGSLPVQMLTQNVGQNFIADKLVDTMRNIRNMFLTDIGIPNVNLAKKSGVTDSEVAANDMEVKAKVSLWFDEISKGMEETRSMFGIRKRDLNIKWREVAGSGTDQLTGRLQSGSDDI